MAGTRLHLISPAADLEIDTSRRAGTAMESCHSEVALLEAWYGKNPYSDFLRKHGKRPGRGVAAAMGYVVGARLRADDGSLQPTSRRARERRAPDDLKVELETERFLLALADLIPATAQPHDVVDRLSLAVCFVQ